MRVKHWQGYGCVNVKKVERKVDGSVVNLHLRVWGNHEWGIDRNDTYDVVRWIGTRCDKCLTDYRQVVRMALDDRYEKINGLDTEVCDYYIMYLLKED